MYRSIFQFIVVLLALALHHDISGATQAPGYSTDLHIHQNGIWKNDKATQFLTYTSVMEYDADTSEWLSDGGLAGLARQAYQEMMFLQIETRKTCPSLPRYPEVMAAMAIGNRVYFASSFKGNGNPNVFFKSVSADDGVKIKSDMTRMLNECNIKAQSESVPGMKSHRTNGNCAEIVAGGLYMVTNQFQAPSVVAKPNGVRDDKVNARIAAWRGALKWDDKGETFVDQGGIIPACSLETSTEVGCRAFTQGQGLVDLRSPAYEIVNQAGTPFPGDSLDNIWLYVGGFNVDTLPGLGDLEIDFRKL